jgi:integrase
MAQQIKLDGKTARLKLPIRKKPYANRIAPGIRLAYRRNEGAGTWSVLGGGGQWLKRIGVADDLELADGVNVLDYWQACERARDLARARDFDTGKPVTVGEALDAYTADLKARGGDPYNATRVRVHLPEALLGKTVALLTARDLKRWRDGLLANGLARGSVSRTIRMAKAALNMAANDDRRIDRAAWQSGLANLPDDDDDADGKDGTRNVILPDATVRRIVAAAQEEGPEFALLVELLAVTGARASQLRRLRVEDLQVNRADPNLMILMMPSSRKGRRKRITHRPVPIPAGLALRLRQAASGSPPHAPLLRKADGEVWKPDSHRRAFERTIVRVRLDPDEVTSYALRHSSIVRGLLAGVPVRVVAALHDTSVTQIERTYSKYIADHADAIARQALLDVEQPAVRTVVPLPAARRATERPPKAGNVRP